MVHLHSNMCRKTLKTVEHVPKTLTSNNTTLCCCLFLPRRTLILVCCSCALRVLFQLRFSHIQIKSNHIYIFRHSTLLYLNSFIFIFSSLLFKLEAKMRRNCNLELRLFPSSYDSGHHHHDNHPM